jgi:hypothetical protein
MSGKRKLFCQWRRARQNFLRSSTVLVAVVLAGTSAFALRDVTLGWDASSDSIVAGYNVYTLEEGLAVPAKKNVGRTSQARITGLKEGLTYSFTVTAYNALGIESLPSAPVTFFVPVPLEISRPTGTNAFVRLRFPISPGRQYQLQASSDLRTWTTIWQTGGALLYTQADYEDQRSRGLWKQFYRLLIR